MCSLSEYSDGQPGNSVVNKAKEKPTKHDDDMECCLRDFFAEIGPGKRPNPSTRWGGFPRTAEEVADNRKDALYTAIVNTKLPEDEFYEGPEEWREPFNFDRTGGRRHFA